MGWRSTPFAQSRNVMSNRPTRPLPSRNGWMVSNWALGFNEDPSGHLYESPP